MNFNNLQIRVKLIIGFLSVSIVAAIIGYLGYNAMSGVKKAQEEIATIYLPKTEALLKISSGQKSVWIGERGLINGRIC